MQPNYEKGISAKLPQNFADRFGWKELADSVAAVVQRLPERERKSVILAGQNYGEAGALEYYGRSLNFPQVISGHNSYWLWGAGEQAEVLIIAGNSRSRMEELFNDVQEGTRTSTGWQMNYECNRPIWICRKPKMSLAEIWPKQKCLFKSSTSMTFVVVLLTGNSGIRNSPIQPLLCNSFYIARATSEDLYAMII